MLAGCCHEALDEQLIVTVTPALPQRIHRRNVCSNIQALVVLDNTHHCIQCSKCCLHCKHAAVSAVEHHRVEMPKAWKKSGVAGQNATLRIRCPLTHCTLLHQAPSDTVKSRPWSVLGCQGCLLKASLSRSAIIAQNIMLATIRNLKKP